MEAAVVAGVGPGLGSALARAFARRGLAVALLSRHAASAEPVAREIAATGGSALAFAVDVTDRPAVAATMDLVRSRLGSIAALAYNASGFGRGSFLDLEPDLFRQSFEVGVMGAVHLAQAVIPGMLAAHRGFISLTGATAALRGRAGFAPLAVAKSGLRMLAQSLAREFHPQGIHVLHVVVDGQIDTPKLRTREPHRSIQTLISPDAIAGFILNAFDQSPDGWTHEVDIRPYTETF